MKAGAPQTHQPGKPASKQQLAGKPAGKAKPAGKLAGKLAGKGFSRGVPSGTADIASTPCVYRRREG